MTEQASLQSDTLVLEDREPLVFISHDSRDAEIAKAFGTLLKKCSAGMLETFRTSDSEGNEGFAYGDVWFSKLMRKLDVATDVVCLFTQRSIDRPWILFEAGAAKGKLGTRVCGIALGIPLESIQTGPFNQLQNCKDDEKSLKKLVNELCGRVKKLQPDSDIVTEQVRVFQENIAIEIKRLQSQPNKIDENKSAMLYEDIKIMLRQLPEQIRNEVDLALRANSGRYPDIGELERAILSKQNDMAEYLHRVNLGSDSANPILVALDRDRKNITINDIAEAQRMIEAERLKLRSHKERAKSFISGDSNSREEKKNPK